LSICFNHFLPINCCQSGTNLRSQPSAASITQSEFKTSEEYASVEESFGGKTEHPIYFIQDAHTSLEAQENIAKIVEQLVENEGVQTVYVEGFQGEKDLDSLFPIPNPETRERVAHFFMDYLRLGGAEYAYLTQRAKVPGTTKVPGSFAPFKIIGIEANSDYQRFYRDGSEGDRCGCLSSSPPI